MGTKRKLFATTVIAGMTAVTSLISTQSGAAILPGPTPPVVNASVSTFNTFTSPALPTLTLAKATAASSWAEKRPLAAGIGDIRAGSNQADWAYVPEPSRAGAQHGVDDLVLGIHQSGSVSFNRDTAVVILDRENNWRTSNSYFGSQFKTHFAEWSSFSTNWTGSSDTHRASEWKPAYKPQSKYKTVSEFCPLDISKEFSPTKGCGRYSESVLSVLRVMDNVINWFKSLWGGGSNSG